MCGSMGRGGTNHDAVAQKQKPKHVVHFVEPDGAHDEVQLHRDGPERQDPHQQHAWDRPEIPRLPWDLSRDLVGTDRCLHCLFAMSVTRTLQIDGILNSPEHGTRASSHRNSAAH